MKLKNKRVISFITAFVFMFSLLASLTLNNVQAYSNSSIFNDVRVGLVSMANSNLTAVLNGSYTLNGIQYSSGTILTLKASNGLVNVNGTDYSDVHLLPLSSSSLVTLTSGTVSYKYQGKFLFKVSSGKIIPVNSLDMESYLKGVVGYEMSDYFPLEALKAQAVAARNYALFKLGAESAKGYDFDDTVLYQVYKGYDERLQNVIKAVDETKFVILLHNDRLVEALYSAWHGGYSEDAVNVWGNPVIYLKAKADSFESDAWPNGNRSFTNAQVDSTLKSRGWLLSTDTFIKLDLASITRYTSGRVANIDILYKDSTGTVKTKSATRDKTRTFLGLPSNMYNVVYDSLTGVYTFSGKGHGHGLGMSQIGAKNRAATGQTYEQILKFYYDGTYIENLTPKASIGSFTISSSEINTNSTVDMITIGSGGSGQYVYRYEILRNGIEVLNTEFSGISSLSYTVAQSGSYEILSYIKDKFSPLSFDDKQSKLLNVVDTNVSMISSIIQSAESILIGQQASFKVTADEDTLYKFEVLRENTLLQTTDFSTSDSLTFSPQQSGLYTVKAYSKHPLSTKEYDDTKSSALTVYDNPVTLTLAIDKAETILSQPIKVTSTGSGGSGSGYLYKYEVITGGNTVLLKDFSSEASLIYSPSMSGSYLINVYMKDAASAKNFDTVKTTGFEAHNAPQILSAKSEGKMFINTPVTISSNVKSGSAAGFTVKYRISLNSTVISEKDLGSLTGFSFTPAKAGTYTIVIYVKDNISEKTFDGSKTFDMEIASAPMVVSKLPIKSGMSGNDVSTIQTGLSKLGFYSGSINGIFGSSTESAVKSYQRSVKIKQTSIVDSTTFNAMNNSLVNISEIKTMTY